MHLRAKMSSKWCICWYVSGTPWCAEAQDVIISRYYVTKMMETLAENGYYITSALTIQFNEPNITQIWVISTHRIGWYL